MRVVRAAARNGWRTIALVVGVAGVAVVLYLSVHYSAQTRDLTRKVDANAADTLQALCALRGDLEVRVDSAETFLRDHPEGIAGIPRATIQVTVDGQKRTINALSGLKCPPRS